MSKKPSRNTGLNMRAQRRRAEGGLDSTDDRVLFPIAFDLMTAIMKITPSHTLLMSILLFSMIGCGENKPTNHASNENASAVDTTDADKMARDIVIQEYKEMYNYGPEDKRIMYQKKIIQRVLKINDRPLLAYFAKDLINSNIESSRYSLMDGGKKRDGTLYSESDKDAIKMSVYLLEDKFKILNDAYPSGVEIFKEMETDTWQ